MNPIRLAAALAALTVCAAAAEDTLPMRSVNRANDVIDAAVAAHGGAERLAALNSLVQESRSTNFATGQSRRPDPPWDESPSDNSNAIDFTRKAVANRFAGSGGGFDFDGGTIIDGETAWQVDYRAGTAAPIAEPDFNTTAGPFIRITPPLLVKQLVARRQTSHWLGEAEIDGRPQDIVTLVMEVGPGLSLYFDRESHLLTRMERVLPPFGQVEYRYEDYETIDGIPFNRRFRLLINGDDNIDTINTVTRVNVPIDGQLQVAASLQRIPVIEPDEFALKEIAEGLFLVGGTAAYGLFVEMEDHVIAIGGTQGAADRLAEVGRRLPGKPVRYAVLSHHHSDHVPGAADYATAGIALIAARAHENAVRAAAGDPAAKVELVDGHMTLSDGQRKVELYDIGPTPHAEHMLIAYLPDQKLVFEADHFPQPLTGPLPPAVPATLAFARALGELGLDVERIAGEHSPRISTAADLEAVLARSSGSTAGAH